MSKANIREWVDAEGAAEVARALFVGIDTVARWTAGGKIPSTRVVSIQSAYAKWKGGSK